MHYYQFHIGDYKSHTHHLSCLEDIAYRRLLDHYYLHETAIKQRDAARLIGMRDHEQEVLSVLDEFFASTDLGYIHQRADTEIAKYREMVDGGKRGAAKRWQSPSDAPPITPPNAIPMPTINHEPITNNHKPIKNTGASAPIVLRPNFIDEQLWNDWLIVRKKKNAPLTPTAWAMMTKQVEKAGWTLEKAIQECCLRTWATFRADWVLDKQNTQQQSFAERDQQARQKRWETMTGRKWPTDGQTNTAFLEIEQ
jgi:hypothetical protein